MKHYLLTAGQKAATGFTDLFVVDTSDLTEATDNTDQAIVLDALEFGDLVGYHAVIEIAEVFNANVVSADCALATSLGVTGALTQIIGSSSLASAGAGVAAKTAYAPAAGGAAYPTPTGGKNLILNMDITDADGALADFTTGKLLVWVNISRWASRNTIQA